jgi:hypothetical protein
MSPVASVRSAARTTGNGEIRCSIRVATSAASPTTRMLGMSIRFCVGGDESRTGTFDDLALRRLKSFRTAPRRAGADVEDRGDGASPTGRDMAEPFIVLEDGACVEGERLCSSGRGFAALCRKSVIFGNRPRCGTKIVASRRPFGVSLPPPSRKFRTPAQAMHVGLRGVPPNFTTSPLPQGAPGASDERIFA